MNTEEKLNRYVLHSYGRYPMAAVRGEGSRLWDSTGKCYLDFCAGIATCVLGHCHPVVTQALQKQAATLVHCSNLYQIPQQADLAEFIVTKCVERPGKVFFSNSGAESNDGLIKVARRYGHRKPQADGKPRYEVLTFNKSFHGRTLGSMSATGQDKIKIGFDPMLPGFRHLPFNDLETAREAIRPETVAFMLETIQGEGGVNCVTPEFLRGLAQLCKEHDLLLLMDEVQCGLAVAATSWDGAPWLRTWSRTAFPGPRLLAAVFPSAASGFPTAPLTTRARSLPPSWTPAPMAPRMAAIRSAPRSAWPCCGKSSPRGSRNGRGAWARKSARK